MEFAVLGLLLLTPMTIYDLNQSFKKSLSLIYSASYGSLQAAIKKLSTQAYIEVLNTTENGRQKKTYHVTSAGKDAFYQWLYAEIPTSKLEVTALSKLHFLGLLESDIQRAQVLSAIVDQIAQATAQLEAYQEALKDLPRQQPIVNYQLATLDYGVMSHRAALAFFKDLLDALTPQ